jgi:hypothetical protein
MVREEGRSFRGEVILNQFSFIWGATLTICYSLEIFLSSMALEVNELDHRVGMAKFMGIFVLLLVISLDLLVPHLF